jgi:hypothetical protein
MAYTAISSAERNRWKKDSVRSGIAKQRIQCTTDEQGKCTCGERNRVKNQLRAGFISPEPIFWPQPGILPLSFLTILRQEV